MDSILGAYLESAVANIHRACRNRLAPEMKKLQGCNSEMLLKYVMDEECFKVRMIPQSMIPFQRSALVMLPDGSTKLCFHKFCQSKMKPFNLGDTDISKCGDID